MLFGAFRISAILIGSTITAAPVHSLAVAATTATSIPAGFPLDSRPWLRRLLHRLPRLHYNEPAMSPKP
jgi:hypothetical protein